MNLALTGILLVTVAKWWEREDWLFVWPVGLAGGLAVGHHRTAFFTLAGVVVFGLLTFRRKRVSKRSSSLNSELLKSLGLFGGLFALAALGPNLYLLWRGGANPASNWSNPGFNNLGGFWQEISGDQYRDLLFAAPLSQSLGRVFFTLNLLIKEFGPVGFALAWLGWVGAWNFPGARPFFWLAFTASLLHLLFAAIYAADNSQVYLIPLLAIWALMEGWGLVWSLTKLLQYGQRQKIPSLNIRNGFLISLILAFGLPFFSLLSNYSRLDLSKDAAAEMWAVRQMTAAPPKAILFSSLDGPTFALWYTQYVKKLRPDLAIVDSRLLQHSWYRANLDQLYPGLKTDLPALNNLPLSPVELARELTTSNPTRPLIYISDLAG